MSIFVGATATTGTGPVSSLVQWLRSLVTQPGARLEAFAVNGVKYLRGAKWKCAQCGWEVLSKKGSTGQMDARIVERIEEHIKEREAMGGCKVKEERQRNKVKKEIGGKRGKGRFKGRKLSLRTKSAK